MALRHWCAHHARPLAGGEGCLPLFTVMLVRKEVRQQLACRGQFLRPANVIANGACSKVILDALPLTPLKVRINELMICAALLARYCQCQLEYTGVSGREQIKADCTPAVTAM